jgi:hypothetical protein
VTIRDWVVSKLPKGAGYEFELVGENGIVVGRHLQRDAHVYCPDASDTEPFTPDDLEQAMEEMPRLQFVTVVRRQVANEAYPLADAEGVAIGGLMALKSALAEDFNVANHKTSQQEYVQGRINGNAHVTNWRRVGENAYEIVRKGSRRDLTIVTIQPYELTSDEVYELLAQHDDLAVDAVVTTNPSCRGFARSTLEAVRDAGTQIMTFRDFLGSLRDPWD